MGKSLVIKKKRPTCEPQESQNRCQVTGVPIGVQLQSLPEAARRAVEIDRGDAESAKQENTGWHGCFRMPGP